MRTLVSILILFLWILIPGAEAMDTLLGRVTSIDHEGGEMIVNIDDTSVPHEESSRKDSTDARKGTKVLFTPGTLPTHVKEGGMVRLWGEYMGDGSGNFRAQHVYHAYDNVGNDPTGVRSRLRKRRGMEKGIQKRRGLGGR
ncbi:MAG: hypothetical protein SVY10_10920 [Thermodesulfobacteriota bacterium]|nr:hypothetical protein [Thermodesulfobacteriota bacterium]